MLRTFDALGIQTDKSLEEPGKALCSICQTALIMLVTETIPIQVSLDDAFIRLFTSEMSTDGLSQLDEVKSQTSEVRPSTNAYSANMLEPKTTDEFKAAAGPKADSDSLASLAVPIAKRRVAFKEYAAANMSIEAISKQIKGQIVSSNDIKLRDAFSAGANKMGKMHDGEVELQGEKKEVAIRVIEFNKIPRYLLENLYLEICYRKENQYEVLIPLLGLACEPPKLYLITPKYKLSLHQCIYQKDLPPKEKLQIIQYFYYLKDVIHLYIIG